ncbi:shikimate kinase [Granulicella sibirica]|uniref:Shikimate kinase n=1 Tax=Granulicella sibirica TaxID=2479048 RepID=A0A4Q0T5X8_9BACT|nr:shikimate kinase [Granulicella sibirica]RXH57026.1 Shikimate kinase I [Granulicella sibirica]
MTAQTATQTAAQTVPQIAAAEVTVPPVALPANTRRILLTGFMGAGKSTVGRALATRLGWAFLDLDHHIEQRTQATIPSLFADLGEPKFRRIESTALASALCMSNIVIALGGGVPEIHTNRLLIEQAPGTLTVFLDAPFPVLFDRCVLQALDRPVLQDPSAAQARFQSRLPHYRRLARVIQQTEDLTPPETVDAVLRTLATCP